MDGRKLFALLLSLTVASVTFLLSLSRVIVYSRISKADQCSLRGELLAVQEKRRVTNNVCQKQLRRINRSPASTPLSLKVIRQPFCYTYFFFCGSRLTVGQSLQSL